MNNATETTKPIVHFVGVPEFIDYDEGQQYARVYGLNHPRLGETWIRTSLLVSEPAVQRFETRNTIYVQVDMEEV